MASEADMMHFEVVAASTNLALPAISFQHLLFDLSVYTDIKPPTGHGFRAHF